MLYLLDASDPTDLTFFLYRGWSRHARCSIIEKLVWFYQQTNHQYIFMPHRRVSMVARASQNLYVDGPINYHGMATIL